MACSVPGVTSLKMPEPGKKPGSSRGWAECGAQRAGGIHIVGGRTGIKFLKRVSPPEPVSGSQFLLPIFLVRMRIKWGQEHRGERANTGGP